MLTPWLLPTMTSTAKTIYSGPIMTNGVLVEIDQRQRDAGSADRRRTGSNKDVADHRHRHQRLQDQLGATGSPFRDAQLAIVVEEADETVACGDGQHDPDEAIR